MLFIVMKSPLLVYNIYITFSGGKGVSYSTDVIRYGLQNICQRIFIPSDPGVIRTFVVDCMSQERQDKPFLYNNNVFKCHKNKIIPNKAMYNGSIYYKMWQGITVGLRQTWWQINTTTIPI